MHEIAKKARELLEKRRQGAAVVKAEAETKRKAEAEVNRKVNLNNFLISVGYAEQDTGEIEIEGNTFLSGSPYPAVFSRCLHLRKTCPHCHQERETSVLNLEDLGRGLEEVQLSEHHNRGNCMQGQKETECSGLETKPSGSPASNKSSAPEASGSSSKTEALVKLLTEIIIEQSRVWDADNLTTIANPTMR